MSFARMTQSAEHKSLFLLSGLFKPFIYDKQQLLLRSTGIAPLNLSTMDDSHFRVNHGLLRAFMLLKQLQIIRYRFLTTCADVITFNMK
jgi:hypothetical protein